MDERALRRLEAVGGGHMSDWWIYRGVIRPKQFVSVECLDGGAGAGDRAADDRGGEDGSHFDLRHEQAGGRVGFPVWGCWPKGVSSTPAIGIAGQSHTAVVDATVPVSAAARSETTVSIGQISQHSISRTGRRSK
jgi:hypothetical protein